MSRGIFALLAWPVGIVLAVACDFALAPSCGGSTCALEPVPMWATLLELALAFGPGVIATVWWRRGRRGHPDD